MFTFCNKQLARERVIIRKLHGDPTFDVARAIAEFDIDNAHCFDPNEELKLRHLMINVIGKNKVTEIIHNMKLDTADTSVTDTYDIKTRRVKSPLMSSKSERGSNV